jgi:general secretion pathway protein G
MRITKCSQSAFTLIELMIALVVLGALAAIAIPSYQAYIERTRVSHAIQDIAAMSMALERYHTENATFPAGLADVEGGQIPIDPWGNPYQYLAIDVDPPPHPGQIRRDKNLNPLNSDYDLYSMGPDGQTQKQLTAAKAKDDVVRAADGSFIGVAKDF